MHESKNHPIVLLHQGPAPTDETLMLAKALENEGLSVLIESHDGHKHVDISIPRARIDIEVDGLQHLTNANQIVSDLNRGYWSHKDGFATIHIPNILIEKHLYEIARALAKACKLRTEKMMKNISYPKPSR